MRSLITSNRPQKEARPGILSRLTGSREENLEIGNAQPGWTSDERDSDARPVHQSTGKMTALADYYHSQRENVLEMRATNKLGADLAKQFLQNGAVEILAKLRNVIDVIEQNVSSDDSLEPEFHGQLQEWANLHQEAWHTIGAIIDNECEACRQ